MTKMACLLLVSFLFLSLALATASSDVYEPQSSKAVDPSSDSESPSPTNSSSPSDTGSVVRSKKKPPVCPKGRKKVCKTNEEFSNCTQTICRQQTCKDKNETLSCPEIKDGSCKSGCVCQLGYLKTPEGKCVPEDQCSGDLVCETNEVVADCPNSGHGDSCPKNENDAKTRTESKVINNCEKPSCTCRFNYMRGPNGTCIPTRECPPFNCTGENEEFNPCPPICPTDDCAQATPSGKCPLPGRIGIVLQCRPNCRCKPGFWRKNNVCVPYSECPGKCQANEEFSNCTQALCRAQNCTQKGKPIACPRIAAGSCKEGCVCSSGFLRNKTGNCVAEDKCPTQECEGQNEVLTQCPNSCAPINCPKSYKEEQEKFKNCIHTDICLPSECRCLPDYRRDGKGRCIPIGECPNICPANEEFLNCTQGLCRAQNCTQKGKSSACTKNTASPCQKGCVCSSGYLRTPEGKCVPEDQCSGDLVCETNEVVTDCPNSGHGDSCPKNENDAKTRTESKVINNCEKPSCTCRFNYMRGPNGTCIPTRECPPFHCSGKNEEFNPCPPMCPTDDCAQATPSGKCPLPGRIGIVLQCRPNCRCKPGFWRKNNVCVPYSECPGKCQANEEFSNCTQALCRAQNCTQKGKPIACPRIAAGSCKEGCVCSSGFLRNKTGNCVAEDNCPAQECEGQNEVLTQCPNSCAPINCPKSYKEEQEKLKKCIHTDICLPSECRCLPDYRRDGKGKCIPIGECPNICPANEEFLNCTQGLCREQNCTQKGKSSACTKNTASPCQKGCVCSSGYLRTPEGKCVPEDQCSGDLVCETNEVVTDCPNSGHGDSCPKNENDAKTRTESKVINNCEKPSCTCRFNYMRGPNGTCIPTRECPPFNCTGENEEFNPCPPICPTDDCAQATPSGKCPLPGRIGILLQCRPNCRCKPGFWRKNNVCVPYSECPGKCQANEEFSNCTQALCRAQNCTQKGKPIACPRIAAGSCKEGCVCSSGFLRNKTGNCVAEDNCPECEDQNEVLTQCPNSCAPINCPKSYKEEQEKLKKCIHTDICLPSECRCFPDYRRDGKGRCIPIGECPNICPANEEFSSCTQGLCRAQNCTEKGKPIACPKIAAGSCKEGCVCSSGFLRNETGNCVAKDKCPGCLEEIAS